jgi:uncharacterized FlgJ-related protein
MINLAKSLGVKYIDIMVAQARIETGWYTSKIFIHNKNLFGLKIPHKRSTTAIGEKNNHAYYNKWEDSVMDYYLFCEYIISKRDIKSKNEWIKYIGKNYAEDIYYEKKIKKIIVSLN